MHSIIIVINWQMYSIFIDSIIASIRVLKINNFWQNLWFVVLFKK